MAIWCKHRWKDSQHFHSYTCADFISGRKEKHFFTGMNGCWVCPGHNHTRASIWIKQRELCVSFCVLYSNFCLESNETWVITIFFYRALSWAKKICTNSEPLKRKNKPKRELQSLAFLLTLRQGNLGFSAMRLTWKALYKHVNEAQQQLRSQEKRVPNERGWLKGTSGRKRPCESPIFTKEKNCTR